VERFFILINLDTFIVAGDVLENITTKKAEKIIFHLIDVVNAESL
jgi:hypothetical protein